MITFATPPSDESIRLAQKVIREHPDNTNPVGGNAGYEGCRYNGADGTHCLIGTMLIERGLTPEQLAPFEGSGPAFILVEYGVLPTSDVTWLEHLQTTADSGYSWGDIIVYDDGAIESPYEGEDEYVE